MITIIVSMLSAAATTAAIYWYLHRSNPDLAQKVTDELVDQVKEDAQAGVDALKDKVS